MNEQLDVYTYAQDKGAHFKTGSSGREWISRCINPQCGSRHDAFSVQPEGKLTGRWSGYGAWMCRKCWDPSEIITVEHGPERGSQRKRGWGTIADLVMLCEGIGYKEAHQFILGYDSEFIPIASRPPLQTPKTDEVWFRETLEYLDKTQWVGQDERNQVQQYLSLRGLTMDTAKDLGMGYSLDKVKLEDGSFREIPFLVIPWYEDKAKKTLYRKVNRRNLHDPLPDDEPKYKIRWQSTHDALYLGECLVREKRPTFLVESEFCAATIMQEAGDLVHVVATGSTEGARNAVNEYRLRRQPFVFVAFDVDASGEKASIHWLERLDTTKSTRYKPIMHDVNEMHTSGLSVRQWVEGALELFCPATPIQSTSVELLDSVQSPDTTLPKSVTPLPAPGPGQQNISKSDRIEIYLHKKLFPEKVIAIAQQLQQVGVTFTPSFGYIKIDASFPLLGNPHLTAAAVHTWVMENEPVLVQWVEQQQGFHTSSIA